VQDAADAWAELKELYIDRPIDDYISKFQELLAHTGIREVLIQIDHFLDGLSPAVLAPVSLLEPFPTTLDGVYKAVTWIYQNLHRAQTIANCSRRGKGATAGAKTEQKQDRPVEPVVGIKKLLVKERSEHMKKELCFRCHWQGYWATDYNADGTLKKTMTPTRFPSFPRQDRKTGPQIYAFIKMIIADLDPEKKEKSLQEMETQGFWNGRLLWCQPLLIIYASLLYY